VTVLFADLVGSTELGGSLDPEYTRDLLDRFYEAMAAEIAVYGGTLEKFIGDAVVAVFGAPAAREAHAERALDAALAMQTRMGELFGDRLALRIGVNTGEVVVGRPREGSSFVTGDTVNVAARLEQNAGPGQVLVGERTTAAVGAAFEFGERRTIAAKGKPGGVVCRELRRVLSPSRPRAMGLETAFVGRERELAWLEAELGRCRRDRRPRHASLIGEPGLGKTSLVREFRARVHAEVRFHDGRCVSYGRGVTYSPLAGVLRARYDLTEDTSPEVVLGRLFGREILGLTLGLDAGGSLDPRGAAERFREEWVRLVTDLAAEGPVVLVVEDLHWASEPLRDLLERLVSDVQGPLLLLTTTRPDHPRLRGDGESATLEPLTATEADLMLNALLGADLSPQARDFLTGRAEGNPFFLEELLSTLIDRDVLRRGADGWTLGSAVASLEIPDSVRTVLAARIDMLRPAEKRVLQAAAVIGRTFAQPALEALAGTGDLEVETLVERGFLRRVDRELVFKHALTWEVVYGSLPKATRARLHAAFASQLEAAGGDRDGTAATLAHHYAHAVDPDIAELAWRGEESELERLSAEALRWLGRAAELAVGRYDIAEALALLNRGVGLAPDDVTLWRAIGRAHALRFDGEAFWTAMLTAIERSSDPGTVREIYAELAFESTVRGAMWRRYPDSGLVSSWVEWALEPVGADDQALARALVAKAWADDDVAAADRALAVAERLGDVELVSHAMSAQWALAQYVSDFAGARAWAQRRLALTPRLTDPDHLALIHWEASVAELAAGRIEAAEAHAHRHDAIGARLSPHHAVHAIANLLAVREAAGEWEQIRALQSRTEEVVSWNADTPCAENARCLLVCATACAHSDLDAEAVRLERAGNALGLEGYEWMLDPLSARLALIRGDHERVASLLDGSGTWHYGSHVHVNGVTARLDALIAVGRNDDAESEALTLLQPGTYLEPFALRTLGLVRGDHTLLEQAADRFGEMGLRRHAATTRAAAGGREPG
jgi:class 3 adenylate cyclase